jgi:predicted HicB family RNase H-like nuclease
MPEGKRVDLVPILVEEWLSDTTTSRVKNAGMTLNIDPELHRELKIEAAKQGMKLSELVEQLLREGLKKTK